MMKDEKRTRIVLVPTPIAEIAFPNNMPAVGTEEKMKSSSDQPFLFQHAHLPPASSHPSDQVRDESEELTVLVGLP